MRKNKRQRTRWDFLAVDGAGGGVRVGRVFNPKWRYKPDIVRILIKARHNTIDMHMTLDEALVIAAGLTKVVGKEIWESERLIKEFRRAGD